MAINISTFINKRKKLQKRKSTITNDNLIQEKTYKDERMNKIFYAYLVAGLIIKRSRLHRIAKWPGRRYLRDSAAIIEITRDFFNRLLLFPAHLAEPD